jgi:hypothetical protein
MLHVLSSRSQSVAQTLVRLNTVRTNSNLKLIDFVGDQLAGLGVRSGIARSGDRRTTNLFAPLGVGKPAGVIVSGHTSIADINGVRRGPALSAVRPGAALRHTWRCPPSSGGIAERRSYAPYALALMIEAFTIYEREIPSSCEPLRILAGADRMISHG